MRAKLLKDMVELIVMKSNIDSADPQGANERIDTEEAKYAKSKTERLAPSRENCRKDIALPRWMPSSKETIEPTRANPHAKTEEPIGAKLRTEREEPKCPSWNIDNVEPNLEKPLRDMELPIWDLSKTEIDDPS